MECESQGGYPKLVSSLGEIVPGFIIQPLDVVLRQSSRTLQSQWMTSTNDWTWLVSKDIDFQADYQRIFSSATKLTEHGTTSTRVSVSLHNRHTILNRYKVRNQQNEQTIFLKMGFRLTWNPQKVHLCYKKGVCLFCRDILSTLAAVSTQSYQH